MHVIPVINCPDLSCVQHTLHLAESFLKKGDYIHLDVADGAFTFHKTWSNPEKWRAMRVPFSLEVHLMVEHPAIWVEPWLAAGAKRFIVHGEALTERSFDVMVRLCEKYGADIMLSSNPETSVLTLKPYLHRAHFFQVLAVHPGFAGQAFLPLTLQKITWLRKNAPHAIIEVDGGMNPQAAKQAKDAGADIIVSSSYIFDSTYPKKAYERLRKI